MGIDIGGANLKVASEEGWEIIYFPIWKNLELLETKLKGIAEKYKVSKVGVVITAELADVFRNKEEGVKCIAEVCKKVFRHVYFLNINGEIKEDIDNPRAFAASNWLASVKLLLKDGYRNFLFVDMGSTTTDLIPVTEK
ncbi:MAG: H4MPT-linked C1 transfer pathway protein, partial [Candidatus Methanomethylicota archaeon]